MKRTISLAGVPLALALLAPAAVQAAPKPPPGSNPITATATPPTVVLGRTSAVAGQVTGDGNGGVSLTLEQDPFPFDAFERGPTGVTDATGNYTFAVQPAVNTKYRVEAKTKPPVTSAEVVVNVRPRVSLRLSDSTPAPGRRVRFSGFVYPQHDGARVSIQRRTTTGRFATVARPTLRDAGDLRSRYVRSLAVAEDGVYRVRIASHDDHIAGFSPRRSVNVR